MNRTMKKVLSIVMVVMMFASAVPMTAFAALDWRCAAGNHNYGWVVTTQPTCTQKGVSTEMCTRGNGCTATTGKTKAVDALGHKEAVIEAKEPTCTVDGNKEGKYCSVCNVILVACETIPSKGHTAVAYETIPATCTANGKTAGTMCSVCDVNITGGSTILASGHNWVVQKYTAADCKNSEKGSRTDKCSVCNEEKTYEVDYAHIYGEWVVTTQPTCSTKGIYTRTCSVCGNKETKDIEMLAHTPEAYAEVAPTCTMAGSQAGTRCKVCKENLSGGEPVNATGHSLSTVAGIAPTCTEKGKTDGIFCTKCDYIQQEMTEIVALGHNMVKDEKQSYLATCKATGLHVEKCSNAGCSYQTTKTLPVTHQGDLKIEKEATCTENGLKTGYCPYCKETVVEVIPATGHKVSSSLSWKVTVAATCTKEGVLEATCETCLQKTTKAIEKIGHKEVVNPGYKATCKKPGLTDGKWCEYCGEETVSQEVIPLAAHTYGEWKILSDSTCAAEGSKEATCTVCSVKTTEKIEKLPHTEKTVPAVAATCTTAGNETGILCEKCGAIVKEALVIEALGHDWVDSGKSVKATCTTDGVDDYKCGRTGCTETKTGVVPATGHLNTETITGTPADCTLTGIQDAIKCKDCNQWVQEQVEIPALGHDMLLVGDKSVPATCEKEGTNFYDCSRCDVTSTEVAPKLAHAFGDWIVDVEATCNTKGEKHRECASCKLIETAEIDNGGGCTIVSMPPVAATCTTKGYTGGTHCEKCKTVYTEQIEVPALGHDYKETTIKASIGKGGQITAECKNCGDVIIDTIDAIKEVKLSQSMVTYTGEEFKPTVIVTDAADEALIEGVDFEYAYEEDEMIAPGMYKINVTFMGEYEGETALTFSIGAGKTSSITTTATKDGKMKLTWAEVEGATGYRVYVYKTVDGKTRKRVASVEGTSYYLAKDYNGKALKMGVDYKIAIVAYTKDAEGNVVHAAAGVAKTFTQTPGKPVVKATSTKGKVTLTWSDVAGETGYTVFYSTSKNGTYTKLTGTKADIVKFTKSLTSGKTYYFKVRAYTKVDGETFRGLDSAVVSVKVK